LKIIIDIPVKKYQSEEKPYFYGTIKCKASDGLQAYPTGDTKEEFQKQVAEEVQMYINSIFEEG